jgi:hypothetical protein
MVLASQQIGCSMNQEKSKNQESGSGMRRQPYERPDFAWEAPLAKPEDDLNRK